VVRLNQTKDEDYSDKENLLDFSGIIEASKGMMETSFNDTRTDNSLLIDVDEVRIPSQKRCIHVHNIFSIPVSTYQHKLCSITV
jgi:hypothetical protein